MLFGLFFSFSFGQRAHKYKQAIEYEEIRKATSSSPTHCELNHELLLQNNTIFSLRALEQFIFSVWSACGEGSEEEEKTQLYPALQK